MVSDFTLSRQRENIAGLEVVPAPTLTLWAVNEEGSQTEAFATREAGGRQSRLRGHATIRARRLRQPSNRAARRGRRASTENQ
jgi:hypothetical protein